MIEDYGGIAHVMPKYAVVFMIATLASIGLPGLNGFAGEFLILYGSFNGSIAGAGSWTWMSTATLLAGTGVILGAVYMLWAYQRVFFGKVVRKENKDLKDLSAGEMSYLLPVCAACFVVGLMPNLLLNPIKASVNELYERPVVTAAVAKANLPQVDAAATLATVPAK
jgi:NADH-quinone oxidoreductase subunit M